MKVISSRLNAMGRESITILVEMSMKEIGQMIRELGKERSYLRMIHNSLDSS
jgi:hypothetical protein